MNLKLQNFINRQKENPANAYFAVSVAPFYETLKEGLQDIRAGINGARTKYALALGIALLPVATALYFTPKITQTNIAFEQQRAINDQTDPKIEAKADSIKCARWEEMSAQRAAERADSIEFANGHHPKLNSRMLTTNASADF